MSVYLGLVLVGGSAPVLAQAALTRDFDIKNEIVFEDDLDKKPDDEKLDFAASLESYFNDAESFINDLQKLHGIEKFNLDYDKFEVVETSFVPCNVDGDPVRRSDRENYTSNSQLKSVIIDLGYQFENWNFLSDCSKNDKFEDSSTSSKFKLFYDNAELNIEISAPKLTKQRAEFLAEGFNRAYKNYKIDEEKPVVKTIYENTSFKSENNQVFIVTRLPRASIDALLAEKDAQ